ncbi:hypothetical protein NDU88_006893 [Pleurodeles waltl]|uniref:Uncharacterized protein n=1 Tax=Pleurodeles waltl TaxID=8319 RepID=A0AAV7PN80_PLEWA|nr:hypothetical protein NDU88_006893 [Pleurodeles waltl]
MSNPLALPGSDRQGKPMHGRLGVKKEDTATGRRDGYETSEENKTRRRTNDAREGRGIVAADYTSKGLTKESVAQEAPSASSGHA